MPLPRFLALHPDAKVSSEDLAALKAYLSPWAVSPPSTTAIVHASQIAANPESTVIHLEDVNAEWNGIRFDPSFESWKPLSYTDRGDNNTFRFILGNDIAVRAAESGNITPWPDGTRFAKIAWQRELGHDGLIHPGKFVQVELMVKDSKKYGSTDGWGWGRWRGLDLKPYGTGKAFVNECTSCHQPVKGNDYVYTLPISSAQSTLLEAVNNRAASLPENLPYQPLRWKPITMFVNPSEHTLSVLYGNESAATSFSNRTPTPPAPQYKSGSILGLVTWMQRDDPHWFGGRIPDVPVSVEFVNVGAKGGLFYRGFNGPGLAEEHSPVMERERRATAIASLIPALFP